MGKFLSPGKKLKLLRKKYGITQNDLTRNGLKRTTLSMVETEKNKLTEKTGKLIVDNINEILCERGSKERVEVGYLLETVENQIEQMLLNYLELISKDENKLPEIIEEINYYKFQIRSASVNFDISKKIGDVYFKNGRYFEALVSYTDIFENLKEICQERNIAIVFSGVFNCLASYFYLRKYRESLPLYKLVESIENYFSKTEFFLLLKLYLATKMELGEFNHCLEKIQVFLKNYDLDPMEEMELKTIQIECNISLKNYFTAKEILNTLYTSDDVKLKLYAKVKEALIYLETNQLEKLEEITGKFIKDISFDEEKSIYKKELYYDLGICLIKLGKEDEGESYLEKSKDIYNSKNYEAIKSLINIYAKRKKREKLIKLSNELLYFIKNKYLEKNDFIIFDLIYGLSQINKSNEIINLIDEIRSL